MRALLPSPFHVWQTDCVVVVDAVGAWCCSDAVLQGSSVVVWQGALICFYRLTAGSLGFLLRGDSVSYSTAAGCCDSGRHFCILIVGSLEVGSWLGRVLHRFRSRRGQGAPFDGES